MSDFNDTSPALVVTPAFDTGARFLAGLSQLNLKKHDDAFAIDPTSLPLRSGPQHGAALFGAMQEAFRSITGPAARQAHADDSPRGGRDPSLQNAKANHQKAQVRYRT